MDGMIQVTRSSMPSFQEYCEEIEDIWESRWLTNAGVKHQELEHTLETYLDIPSVELFTNGHMALDLAIKALQLTGEVITTPYTFASTTQAIIGNGLTPVFCDVEDQWYTLDASKIEPLITEKTSAIIPVHVYGNICDYKAIHRIAEQHGLKVIYDAAHAFGETVDGINVSRLGDISMFSFHATKVFNTVEGGCLTFTDAGLEADLQALRQFGLYGKEAMKAIGTNAKMTEFHAAMGICNMRHIDEYIGKRKLCVERYRERLSGIKGIKLCPVQQNVKSNCAYFPVFFEQDQCGFNRDEVLDRLSAEKILARKYFYPLTSDFAIVRDQFPVNETPVAKAAAGQVLSLPLYSDLALSDVDRICDIILA